MSHYDEKYFKWQKTVGEIGGFLNMFKFEEHIKKDGSLMDFGCGGGYLLNNFKAQTKLGYEINNNFYNVNRLDVLWSR